MGNKPIAFEQFVANHFENKGYKVVLTSASNDYGVDVFAENYLHKLRYKLKCTAALQEE